MNQEELDRAVLEAVRGGANRFSVILKKAGCDSSESYRSVDRSLQRLRKNGSVQYKTGSAGWVVAE